MTDNTNVNPFADIADVNQAGSDAVNANEVQKTGFTKVPARAGKALFRFKSYIETGTHEVQKGQGKGKKQPWADFEFELVHPDHMIGPDDNKFPDTIRLSNINISMNEKAKYHKLFKKMNHSGKFTSFAQMLGQGFYGELVHNKQGDTTYVNMERDGVYLIGAPVYDANTDPLGQPDMKPIPVPEMQGKAQCFLVTTLSKDTPKDAVLKMWDSIEISGEKSDGTERKNWIQGKVRSALDFDGSYIQSIIGGDAVVAESAAADIAAATQAAVDKQADDTADAAKADAPFEADAVVDPLAGIPGL